MPRAHKRVVRGGEGAVVLGVRFVEAAEAGGKAFFAVVTSAFIEETDAGVDSASKVTETESDAANGG